MALRSSFAGKNSHYLLDYRKRRIPEGSSKIAIRLNDTLRAVGARCTLWPRTVRIVKQLSGEVGPHQPFNEY